jgi:hypothetical protein
MKAVRIAGAAVVGLLMLSVLAMTPLYASFIMQRIAPYLPASSVISYFFNEYTLAVGALLSILVALGIAFDKGTAGGTIKVLQALVGMFYFLYLLHFGTLSVTVNIFGMPITFNLVVMLGLAFIELAFALRAVEGIAIIFKS